MATNRIFIQQRDDGNYEAKKSGSNRASAVTPTRAEAYEKGSQFLANNGGGEIQYRRLDGTFGQANTIKPGNDPRSSKG